MTVVSIHNKMNFIELSVVCVAFVLCVICVAFVLFVPFLLAMAHNVDVYGEYFDRLTVRNDVVYRETSREIAKKATMPSHTQMAAHTAVAAYGEWLLLARETPSFPPPWTMLATVRDHIPNVATVNSLNEVHFIDNAFKICAPCLSRSILTTDKGECEMALLRSLIVGINTQIHDVQIKELYMLKKISDSYIDMQVAEARRNAFKALDAKVSGD